jgi:hypothetical protein
MKVTSISYRKTITIKVDRFQFVKIEIGSDADLDGEEPRAAMRKLRNFVMDELDAEVAAIEAAEQRDSA